MFSISVWRGANWDCNSACACLPSAVLPMAERMLITPTLPGAAEPAAAGDCARTPAAPHRPSIRHGEQQNTIVRLVNNYRQIRELINGHAERGRAGNPQSLVRLKGT